MRLLPFNTAASRCATSDLGMRPGSRSRSRPGQPPPRWACVPRTGVPAETHKYSERQFFILHLYDQICGRNRERLAGGAGGGNEHPCSLARCQRNPDRMSLRRTPQPRPASVDHLLPRAPRPDGDTARRDGPAKRPIPFESETNYISLPDYIYIAAAVGVAPFGSSAGVQPSSQTVPRFSNAHITRTR
jgi:hypothetical protein